MLVGAGVGYCQPLIIDLGTLTMLFLAMPKPSGGVLTPKITDFGLAKRMTGDSELTLTGQVLGSPNYLPPEQAAKRLGGDRFRLAGRFAIIQPKAVWDAILEEVPYPVKMLFFISSNPLMTRANAREVST